MDNISKSIIFILIVSPCVAAEEGCQPEMTNPSSNVTVIEGNTAILPCPIQNLCGHRVVWTDQWSTLLTLDDRRIIDDARISIERPSAVDWNLRIVNAMSYDEGQYACQVNTNPVQYITVILTVQHTNL